jgi:hypothetical protein
MTATVVMNRQLVLARSPTGLPSRLAFAELDEPGVYIADPALSHGQRQLEEEQG